MKKIFLLIACLATFSHIHAQQCLWKVQRGPDSRTLTSLCFVDSLHGWIGRIPYVRDGMLRTTNGGQTWDTVNFTFQIGSIGSISFIDTLQGWCSNPSLKELYKSTDGGLTWSLIYQIPIREPTFGIIHFADSLHGWTVSEDSVIVDTRVRRTTDGGETWLSYQIQNVYAFAAMKFVDTLHGWIVGGRIYATTDGGISWNEQMFDRATVRGCGGVDFINPMVGWCAGGGRWTRKVDHSHNRWRRYVDKSVFHQPS